MTKTATKLKLLSTFLEKQGVDRHLILEPQVKAAWTEYQAWVNNGLVEGQSVLQTAKHFRSHKLLGLELIPLDHICDLLRGFRDYYQEIQQFLGPK